MRKKRLMIAIACIILVGIAVIVFFSQQGKKPYKDLDAAQIVSAKVLLTPPDKTIEIENIQELVEYLNDVVVYNEDNSYTEYAGQGVVFTLTMVDGTQTDIMAYNPFIVIDGIGYKTKYEPCEALNSYANELLMYCERFPILGERRKQKAGLLSGGQQQMLAIARSLMSRPKLLMLDEPSLGLAPVIVAEVYKIIEEINKEGTSILLVEQNAKKALSIANRAYILVTGEITLTGEGKQLLEDDSVRQAYLGV